MADGASVQPPTTAAGIAEAVRARAISAAETVAAAFAGIEAANGELHAFCTLARAEAEAAATAVDARLAAGEPVGPLAGVPVAVKDLIATRGIRTTFGSPLYADFVPDEDDVVVERLQAAGAIVVGKTNSSEFGYGPFGHNPLFPATRNPWNPALTPGSSSAACATPSAPAARTLPSPRARPAAGPSPTPDRHSPRTPAVRRGSRHAPGPGQRARPRHRAPSRRRDRPAVHTRA